MGQRKMVKAENHFRCTKGVGSREMKLEIIKWKNRIVQRMEIVVGFVSVSRSSRLWVISNLSDCCTAYDRPYVPHSKSCTRTHFIITIMPNFVCGHDARNHLNHLFFIVPIVQHSNEMTNSFQTDNSMCYSGLEFTARNAGIVQYWLSTTRDCHVTHGSSRSIYAKSQCVYARSTVYTATNHVLYQF